MYQTPRIARKLATLQALGFERTGASPATTEVVQLGRRTHCVTSSRPAMGTLVSVSALASSQHRAEEAIGRAFDEMDRLIGIFSRYEPASAITYLNDAGRLDGTPPEFEAVVSRSLDYHALSRGAFDISVAPVLDLFQEHLDGITRVEPTPAEVREAAALVGATDIRVERRRVGFSKAGMRITLDGIAKGYIVDAIAQTLRRHKIKNYLINAGGDIRTAGTKPGKQPWTVAVQNPMKDGNFPDTIHVTDAAIATSGSYEIYFDRNRQFHHIVNAKTGRSPDECVSVSVIAPSTMAADALSTTVFVMGPSAGLSFIERLPGCACLIIDQEGRQLRSRGWMSAASNTRRKVGS